MNRDWPPEALAFRDETRLMLAELGGVDLARRAEEKPQQRSTVIRPALDRLGVLDLDPLGEIAEAAAAALAVRACGEVVAPLPVAQILAVPTGLRGDCDGLFVVDGAVAHLAHADLFERAQAIDLADGQARRLLPDSSPSGTPLDPFGTAVEIGAQSGPAERRATQVAITLECFWVAGALHTATRLAAEYAVARKQFGTQIGRFGEIRWRLADMAVALDGLDELCTYTWLQVLDSRAGAADVWSLRLGMQEAADKILANGHQVFGAIGLCEEHDLTVLDRHVAAARFRPTTPTRTAELLLEAVAAEGFRATFDIAGDRLEERESSPPGYG